MLHYTTSIPSIDIPTINVDFGSKLQIPTLTIPKNTYEIISSEGEKIGTEAAKTIPAVGKNLVNSGTIVDKVSKYSDDIPSSDIKSNTSAGITTTKDTASSKTNIDTVINTGSTIIDESKNRASDEVKKEIKNEVGDTLDSASSVFKNMIDNIKKYAYYLILIIVVFIIAYLAYQYWLSRRSIYRS
jgi:polyhydroxyalkanoate synthesis regulator phasin